MKHAWLRSQLIDQNKMTRLMLLLFVSEGTNIVTKKKEKRKATVSHVNTNYLQKHMIWILNDRLVILEKIVLLCFVTTYENIVLDFLKYYIIVFTYTQENSKNFV